MTLNKKRQPGNPDRVIHVMSQEPLIRQRVLYPIGIDQKKMFLVTYQFELALFEAR
ncbi:MAG: hypothetical protein OXC03_08285 [Flavobacteriaceae bacterium]|nr:hypothetical protein [Flavobacteriaceae bacterium]